MMYAAVQKRLFRQRFTKDTTADFCLSVSIGLRPQLRYASLATPVLRKLAVCCCSSMRRTASSMACLPGRLPSGVRTAARICFQGWFSRFRMHHAFAVWKGSKPLGCTATRMCMVRDQCVGKCAPFLSPKAFRKHITSHKLWMVENFSSRPELGRAQRKVSTIPKIQFVRPNRRLGSGGMGPMDLPTLLNLNAGSHLSRGWTEIHQTLVIHVPKFMRTHRFAHPHPAWKIVPIHT